MLSCMKDWLKHCRVLSILLALWLACFSAHAAFSAQPTSAPTLSLPTALNTSTSDNHQLSDLSSIHPAVHSATSKHVHQTDTQSKKVEAEQRAPAKSIIPTLSSVLRNGSFAYERLNESEPSYELVFDLDEVIEQVIVWRVYLALDHWHDWTLTPPATLHRVSGWKESNILYRFISQADA